MFRFFLALVLAATTLSAHAEIDYSSTLDAQALNDVVVYLDHKDCKGALGALNKGVTSKQRAVLLLAGSMYEQGLCLKQDWDKAAHFYQLAHEAGNVAALPRLVAGYAEQRRDPAAALWWLAQSPYVFVPACSTANSFVNDPDAFVAALKSWPAGQLEACTYSAGVMMRLIGEIEFPSGAHQGVAGAAILVFTPSAGSMSWSRGDTNRIAVTRIVRPGEHEEVVFKDVFLKHVQGIGERTLALFARPEGIPPEWKIPMAFQFNFDRR